MYLLDQGLLQKYNYVTVQGADPKIQNVGKTTVLHYLVRNDSTEIMPVIAKMIEKGLSINCKDKYGEVLSLIQYIDLV
jgi:hypothetical protein